MKNNKNTHNFNITFERSELFISTNILYILTWVEAIEKCKHTLSAPYHKPLSLCRVAAHTKRNWKKTLLFHQHHWAGWLTPSLACRLLFHLSFHSLIPFAHGNVSRFTIWRIFPSLTDNFPPEFSASIFTFSQVTGKSESISYYYFLLAERSEYLCDVDVFLLNIVKYFSCCGAKYCEFSSNIENENICVQLSFWTSSLKPFFCYFYDIFSIFYVWLWYCDSRGFLFFIFALRMTGTLERWRKMFFMAF